MPAIGKKVFRPAASTRIPAGFTWVPVGKGSALVHVKAKDEGGELCRERFFTQSDLDREAAAAVNWAAKHAVCDTFFSRKRGWSVCVGLGTVEKAIDTADTQAQVSFDLQAALQAMLHEAEDLCSYQPEAVCELAELLLVTLAKLRPMLRTNPAGAPAFDTKGTR